MSESWVKWVQEQIGKLYSYLNKLRNDTIGWIQGASNAAKAYTNTVAKTLYDGLKAEGTYRKEIDAFLYGYTQKLVGDAYAAAANLVSSARKYSETLAGNAYAAAANLIGVKEDLLKGLINGSLAAAKIYADILVNNATGGLLKKIGDIQGYIDTTKCVLMAIVTDPIGFIISLLEFFFIDWVQYEIAYQFGTQDATLPPKPSFWKKIC